MKSIAEFPVLQSTQFQFITTSEINNRLILIANDLGLQKQFLSLVNQRNKWTKEMHLAFLLHSNPRFSLIIDESLIDRVGHEKAINAFRFLGVFIKDVKLRPVDRAAIILWFIQQGVINIDKVIEFNKIEIPPHHDESYAVPNQES